MSVDQYQRTVNSLDKDIAKLEKEKAVADKKAADEARKAANIKISKIASASTIKNKLRQQEQHQNNSNKAVAESAELGRKIADKRTKRNDAYLKLQKEQQKEQQKNQAQQDKIIKNMQSSYEQRITELTGSLNSAIAASVLPNATADDVSEESYDVFISHAWEDKESFADELDKELRKLGLKVWYDTNEIKWGDSMRKRIDEGLRKSRYGIVILSPNYIAEGKYWTKTELDGLFQLESSGGKRILPIWHNLTKKEVMEYSPIVASKLAMTTATMTAEEIANELAALFSSVSNRENEGGLAS